MGMFNGIYRGKVLSTDAEEEEKLGRIKVEVYPMLLGEDTARNLEGVDGISIDLLPWATPAMPLFSGAGDGYGSFIIPEVDSFVFVFFEGGDVYQPVYFAEAQTAEYGLPSERMSEEDSPYPYMKVWKSSGGIVVTINDSEGNEEIKVLHPKGAYIQIDSSGNINIDTPEDVNVTSEGDVNITGTKVNINP